MTQPTLTVVDASGTQKSVFTQNPNGATTSVNSQPIVVASDQSPIPVTGTVTGTITTNAGIGTTTVGLALEAGHIASVDAKLPALTVGGKVPVDGSAVTQPVTINNLTATGPLTTLASTLGALGGSRATIGVQVTGNGVGFTLTPQASMDGGTTWINVGVLQAGAGSTSTPITAITGNGNWEFSTGGYTNFQLTNTVAATSGTVTGSLVASNALKIIRSSAIGDQADTNASWYTQVGSLLSHLKLLVAATVDAGSHVYGYTSGNLTTDAWTLFGTTRTKTFTYTSGVLTAESDWV